jgi:ferredoxin
MHTVIFYFSGTGNSLKLARDIAAEIGDAEIVPIARAFKEPALSLSGRIGFVFPVYALGVPLIVSDLVDKMKAEGPACIFAVATMGGVAGDPLGQLAKRLDGRGMKLSSGFVIQMPSNYTPFGGALKDEAQKRMFDKAARRVKEIASIVKDGRESRVERSGPFFSILGGLISPLAVRTMRGEDKKFRLNDKCTGCGTCARVCPVDNIKLVDKKPAWLHKCEQCFACLQWCPEEAIECGRHTAGRKRYRNPFVNLQDMMSSK